MTTKVTGSILANTAVTAGRYGGAATVGTFTVDAQGRLIDSGNTTIAITSTNLDATGVTGATYGGGVTSSTHQVPVITVDTKGRITAASNVSVSSTAIYANTGQLVANSATGVVQIGLATSGANPGSYGSGTTTPVIQVDALGRITSVSSVLITGGSAGTGSTTYNRTTATATAGQTLFSSIPHTVGYLQVYVNGVLLTPNDYTANASNSAVVLTTPASSGDQFEAFAYTTTLANNLSPGTTGGSGGVILYQSAANTTSNTIVGTSGQVLTSAGTGQPTWTTLATSATTDTTNANNITSGTVATARLSGSYTGITGVGTLSAGSIPSSLITGLTSGFSNMVVLTSTNASYSIPATKIKVTVVGGGGPGATVNSGGQMGGGGGAGGIAVKILSGLTIGNTLNVTIGGSGGNTTVASGTQSISTITGGAGGTGPNQNNQTGFGAVKGAQGGIGSGGDLNIRGGVGGNAIAAGDGVGGVFSITGAGGTNAYGGGGVSVNGLFEAYGTAGNAGSGYGGGGSGGLWGGGGATGGGAGSSGVVIVEY